MRNRKIGVGTFTATPRMYELVNQVLDSGRISYGPMSADFEQQIASIHGAKYGILSNSGTSSLQVALQAMKEHYQWPDGSEVIIPAVTFVATANIVLHNRMVPVPVDVDWLTYNINPDLIEYAITPRTKAIIPVHLFGQMADMNEIMDIATRHGLMVIEDACESMFASYYGQGAGSIGHVGCFSTYVAHLVTTGVGGVSITNNHKLAERMRSLVNHGRDGIFFNPYTSKEQVEGRFRFVSVGHSFRITELEAAVGLAQLDGWENMISTRRRNAVALTGLLQSIADDGFLQLPYTADGRGHSFMMYPIMETLTGDKWPLVHYLEAAGIETREMLPLVNQPVYEHLWNEDDYPVAKQINEAGFYVGIHQDLTMEDIDYIADIFYAYFYT